MGSLRTLFALSVVFAHSYGFVFVGSRNAVQLFYVISGFLISYILVERKTYRTLRDFYINRYLRLYPVYAFVALVTLFAYVIVRYEGFFDVYKQAPHSADFLLTFSNLFLFGQDWVMFAGIDDHHLVFALDFTKSDILLNRGLLVQQAWTLGVELTFYLIAPFVLQDRKTIYFLLTLSVAIRLYLIGIGIGLHDPWTYRFFPAELSFFLIGALAHQILLPFYKLILGKHLRLCSSFATYFLVVCAIVYFLIPAREIVRASFFFSAFLVLMPLTFVFQNTSKVDNWIAELSYPIYIGHKLILMTISFLSPALGVDNKLLLPIVGVLSSLAFAIFLNIAVARPVERLRNHFRDPGSTLKSTQAVVAAAAD
jgi:peptidoglycan/LPS O-acetylase OafA/YrhL